MGSLRGKVKGEGAFDQSVVEEPVVRTIITRFEWRVSFTIDIEDVEYALRPVHVGGDGHDPNMFVSVMILQLKVKGI